MANKTYDVDVGGKTYEVDAPDPNTAWAWANQYAASQKPAPASPKPAAVPVGPNKPADSIAKWQGMIGRIDNEINGLVASGADDIEIDRLLDQRNSYQKAIETTTPAAEYVKRTGKPVPTMGAGDIAAETLKSIPRGAIQSAGQIGGIAGVFGPGGEQFAKGIERGAEGIVKGLGLTPSEAATINPAGVATTNVGSGFGSIVPYIIAGEVGAPLRAINAARAARVVSTGTQAALGTGQGASEARQRIEAFEKETGETIDPLKRQAVQAGGAAIGLTELLPLPSMLKRSPAGEFAGSVLSRIGGSSLKEGAQEGGTTLAQNVQERLAYDPRQNVLEGVPESAALGAIVGGGVRGIREALGGVEAPLEQGAPVTSDAPSLRTVTIGMTPPRETWEVDKDGKEIEPPPVPTSIEILSEPDEGGFQTVRFPDGRVIDGRVIEVPASEIENRLIPEAAPTVAAAPGEPVMAADPVAAAPASGRITPAPITRTTVEIDGEIVRDEQSGEPIEAVAPTIKPEPTVSAFPGITDITDFTEPVLAPAPAPAPIEPITTAEPTPAVAIPALPTALSRAKPDFEFGPDRFALTFDNDLDKAVYIATSPSPSKTAAKVKTKYLGWLNSKGISDPVEIEAIGLKIRNDIRNNIRVGGANPAEPMRLPAYSAPVSVPVGKIPDAEVSALTPAPAPAMAAPLITPAPVPAPTPAPGAPTRFIATRDPAPTPTPDAPVVPTPTLTPTPTPAAPTRFIATREPEPEPVAVAPAVPTPIPAPVAVAAPTLPAALAVAKPRYKGHPVDWTGSDVERAAYIATSDMTPEAKSRFVDWLSRNNIPDDQVASIGAQVRSELEQASAAAPKTTAPLKAPAVFNVAAPTVTIKATPKVAPQAAAAIKSKKGNALQIVSQIIGENAQAETEESQQLSGGEEPMAETIRSKPGVNARRMAKMLGPQLYGDPTDMGAVSIKEILQNSFDAIKGLMAKGTIKKGRISINTSSDGHTIKMIDNGSGMTPQLLGGKFLEIAGTGKESENASGGFGIAKMLFLYGNDGLRVITMRDGKVSELNTSGPQLFDSLEDENAAPDIEVRQPSKADRAMFPDGHGTFISITTPMEFDDPTTGGKKSIKEVTNVYSVKALRRSPMFADIDVDFNGSTVYGIGSEFKANDYTSFVKVKFPWGTADVYVEKEPNGSTYGENIHVLSNGLWQFSSALKKNPKESYGDNIPRTFYVDIHPSVKPEEPGYPFSFNRQSLTEQAKSDYNKIINYINAIYAIDSLSEGAKSFGEIKYFDENGELGAGIDLMPNIPVIETDFSKIKAGDNVEVKDGRLIVNGKELPELTPDQLKNGIPSADELKMDPSLIDPNRVMAHDNVEVEQPDETYVPFSDYMRVKFGDRFDQYAFMVGDAFKTLRDEVASLMGYLDPTYLGLTNEAVGVSFDKEYRGVSIRLPFPGMFINPAIPEDKDPITAGFGMVGTMIHELAHFQVRSHNADFPAEMQRIQNKLKAADRAGGFPFSWFEGNVVEQTREFADILAEAQRVYDYENIRPRGNRFSESSYESISEAANEGEPSGDNGNGRTGRTGQRLLSQSAKSTGATGRGRPGRGSGAGATQAGNVGQPPQQPPKQPPQQPPQQQPQQQQPANTLNAASVQTNVVRTKSLLDFLNKKFGTKYAEADPFNQQVLNAINASLPPDKQLARLPEGFDMAQGLADLNAKSSGASQVFNRNEIEPFRKAIIEAAQAGADPQDLGMALWARSAPDRNRIVDKNTPDFQGPGSGLTDVEARAELDDLFRSGKMLAINKFFKVHDALVDKMIKMRVDNGLMTAAEAVFLRKEQPFYTPLKGWALAGDMNVPNEENPHSGFDELRRKQKGISPREYRKASGRKTMPFNPIANLMVDAQNLVLRIEKNTATLPLLNNLLIDPAGTSDIAKVYTDKNPKRVPGAIDKVTGKRKWRSMNMKSNATQFLVVKKNGVAHYIEFENTDGGRATARAYANMTPEEIGEVRKGYRAITAALKSLMTRFNPYYLLRTGPIRDLMDSIVTAYSAESMPGGAAEGKKIAKNTIRYAFSPTTWGATWGYLDKKSAGSNVQQQQMQDLYETMLRDGGTDGNAMISDAVENVKGINKELARLKNLGKQNPILRTQEGVQAVGDFMTKMFEFTNTVFRFATYRAALEAGITPADAARLARQSTVDLSRKGEWSGTLDDFYFFANPSVQSTIKQTQMLKSRNGRRVLASFVMLGALTSLWNQMIGGGDDDDDGITNYDDLADTKKMANLIIYFGPKANDYVALPFGFLVSFPAYAGQKIAELVMGSSKPESVAASLIGNIFEVAKGAMQAYSPVKVATGEPGDIVATVMPSILQWPISVLRNKDYWGKSIFDKPFDEGEAKSSVGRESTGAGYKWFAQMMNDATGGSGNVKGYVNFQPEFYRYFINGMGGGPVKTLRDIANLATTEEKKLSDIPVLKSYLGSGGEYAAQNSFYENTLKMDQIAKSEEDDAEEAWAAKERKYPVETDSAVIDAYKDATKALRQFYKDRNEALEGVTDLGERKRIFDEMKPEKDEIYSEFNRTYYDTKRGLVGSRREVRSN